MTANRLGVKAGQLLFRKYGVEKKEVNILKNEKYIGELVQKSRRYCGGFSLLLWESSF